MRSVWVSIVSGILSIACLIASVTLFAYTNIAKHKYTYTDIANHKSHKSHYTLGQVLVPFGGFYCWFALMFGLLVLPCQHFAKEEKEFAAKLETRKNIMKSKCLAQPEAVPEGASAGHEDANADAPWLNKVKNRIKRFSREFYTRRIRPRLQDRSNLLRQILTLVTEIGVLAVSSVFVYFMVPEYTEPKTQKLYKGYDHLFFWSLFSFSVHSFSTIVLLRGCLVYDFVLGVTVLILIQEGTFLQKDHNTYHFLVAIATGGFFIVAKAYLYYWNKEVKKENKKRLAAELKAIVDEVNKQAEDQSVV